MTGPDTGDLKDLAAAYVLGALEPAEHAAFEAFLATSPEAQREVAEYREVNALLALGAPAAAPSADLRERVLARAGGRGAVVPLRPRTPPLAWVALAASLVAAAGSALAWRSARADAAARALEVTALRDTLHARELRLAEREATLNAILEPTVSLTRLTVDGTDKPVVQLFWNHRANVSLVHVFNLRPAADRRVYQLWFIPKGGAPIPSITFNTEPSGHGMVEQIPVPAGVELVAAAVTDEPAGGSPQPTTTPLVVGSFAPVKS